MMQVSQFIQSILTTALLHIAEGPVPQPLFLHVALGELSDIDPQVLQQEWNELSKGTILEHAQVHIRLVPAEVQCMACFSKYQPVDQKIYCPYCGSFGAKILSGAECKLESIGTEHD